MKATGTWLGEYTYGPDYGALAGKSVPFTVSLTESWLRKVIGYVRDDATKGGQPERGRITGTRKGADLTFVKTMPTAYVTDPDGTRIDVPSALRRDHGVELPALPPHRIDYTGTLAADGQTITGRWEIRPTTIETQRGTWQSPGGKGTWTARRVSDLPTTV